ncbi:hypothetical protein P4O66_010448, partial [Electrophorus voltai]
RSYVGLELVRWLMEQCAFVQSRGAAAGVWNILLELDILLSVERQSMFEDSGALYQFSFEECEAQSCDFRNQSQWQNGVSFLLQLVPHTQLHVDTHKQCDGESRRSPEVCGRVAQMRALERLTSTVRKVCSAAALLKPNTLHNSATIGLVRQFRCSACSQRRKARECPRRTACLLCVTFVDFCGHRDGPASAELNRPVPAALQVVMFGAFIQYVRYQGHAECALPPAIKVMLQNCPASDQGLQSRARCRPPPQRIMLQRAKGIAVNPVCPCVLSSGHSNPHCLKSAMMSRQSLSDHYPSAAQSSVHGTGHGRGGKRRVWTLLDLYHVTVEWKQGPGAASRDREDISRMEMVQRLAKDGCRLLHSPLRQAERPAEAWAHAGMGSRRTVTLDPLPEGRATLALVEQEEDEDEDGGSDSSSERATLPTFDVPYFRYIDDEGAEEDEWCGSSRSLSSFDEEDSSDSSLSHRYTGVPATPEKVLEHLLSHLRLDEDCGSLQAREAETLLDDFLLTYPVIMSTSDLCQALLGQYPSRGRMKDEGKESLVRKRKVLHLLSEWSALCRATLQEDQHTRLFMKTLYGNVLDDLYEFPSLEKELKDLQKLLRMQRRQGDIHESTVDECSPQRKNKALFHQLSLKENWQPLRAPQTEGKEVLCRVYVTVDSYVSVRTHSAVTAQELLAAVADRLDCAEDDMVLVAVSYSREKALLQPHQCVYTNSLSTAGRLCVCRRDMTDLMSPVPDNAQLQQLAARMLTMNTWDIAVALTNCDWSLFSNLQEQELVYFTLSRDSCAGHTVALELLLQRCNEVQQWVMTEVLLCPVLCKRVQLFKKFIKIAAHCKAQRNLNSFFAIIMGLNTAAVSRLSQTWEKVPGKFKKLFSELESLTDPSFNHKAYRDAFKKMKSPKIPFLPLLLKDITFIHEGNKTFLDNLVNFEKMHMIADTVRIVRQCQTDHMGNMLTQKESAEVRAYINYLHIIDNQQTLFELSHRLEPKV